MSSRFREYLEKTYSEEGEEPEEGGANLPAVRGGMGREMMGRATGFPHELQVKLMSEMKHLQSQPHKYLRMMNDLMPIMMKLQGGEFLKPAEAEEFLNKYKEFDKDVNNPRYFKLLKEFLTTGNWNFAKFKGDVR